MKRIMHFVLTGVLMLVLSYSYCQNESREVTVYKTLKDFQSDKGEKVGNLTNYSITLGYATLIVDNNTKIKVKDYWGFAVDSTLFRSYKSSFITVMSVGKMVYYEMGILHLRGWATTGEKIYFYSKSLSSKIYAKLGRFKRSLEKTDTETLTVIKGIKKAMKTRGINDQMEAVRASVFKLNPL